MANSEFLTNSPIASLLLTGVAGGVAVGGMLSAYDRSPLRDHGTFIFPTPNEDAFAAVLDVNRVNGFHPDKDLSDEYVVRALMTDKSIVNHTVNPDLKAQLDDVGGTRVFKSNNPFDSVRNAQDILGKHGFDSWFVKVDVPIDQNPNQEPADFDVHLLRSEAFPNGVIGFRLPIVKMMLRDGPSSKPPKWDPRSTKSVL